MLSKRKKFLLDEADSINLLKNDFHLLILTSKKICLSYCNRGKPKHFTLSFLQGAGCCKAIISALENDNTCSVQRHTKAMVLGVVLTTTGPQQKQRSSFYCIIVQLNVTL